MGQLIKEWCTAHKHAERSTADPLQLPVSSVSSKQTVDEVDGVSRKRRPPAEWLTNPRAKQLSVLQCAEDFSE